MSSDKSGRKPASRPPARRATTRRAPAPAAPASPAPDPVGQGTLRQPDAVVQSRPASSGDRDMHKITDAREMRALAHPVRLGLLEALGHAGTLTATQASELLGESPANCA